jgi:hypothetical protein
MKQYRLLLLGILIWALSACGSTVTPLAVLASNPSSIGVGEQRLLVALVDVATNEFVASEDTAASLLLRDEDGTPLGTYDLEFVWTVPDVRGVYSANVDIPEAGVYQLTVTAEGFNESGPTGFTAVADPLNVALGEVAPASPSRTIGEFPDLSLISTDPDPDPAFYQLSLDEAVGNGRPTAVIFATPGFCSSQACGPMLDQLKLMSVGYPEIDFVHVEVYQDLQVEPGEDLTVVDTVGAWGLSSEPWIYVVDSGGVVSSMFEGAVSDEDLRSALDQVTSS